MNKRIIPIFTLAVLMALLFTSMGCWKKDVYVAYGSTLWKNGKPQQLEAGTSPVFISGKDVYYMSYSNGVTLLKNGVAQQRLGDDMRANSIFVSGNDVYIAGYRYEMDGTCAMLWKNGVPQRLSDAGYLSEGQFVTTEAKFVLVSGKDVYVVGNGPDPAKGNIVVATLWKNGTPQHLGEKWSSANSVFVSGNDVYVVGGNTLWKNGVTQPISHGSAVVNSVFVKGKDVYVAGYENIQGKEVATLWKNGVAQRLIDESNNPEANSSAHSVFVSGKNVYVGVYVHEIDYDLTVDLLAYKNTKVTLWKNGKHQFLGEGSSYPGDMVSVFVK